MLSANRQFGPNRYLKYLIAGVVQNSDMPVIELGRIDSDLGRNKLCLCNRTIVIRAIQPQRVLVSTPISYVKIVMWHDDLRLREARQCEPGLCLNYFCCWLFAWAWSLCLFALCECCCALFECSMPFA